MRETSTKSTREKGANRGTLLCQHLFALAAVQQQLVGNERLFALLEDIYITCSPGRVAPIFNALRRELWTHSRIQIHLGKNSRIGTKEE